MRLTKSNSRARILGSHCWFPIAAALLYPISTTGAAAQTAVTPEPVTSSQVAPPQGEADRGVTQQPRADIPDIVVTARKTSESIQDVPIAITALNTRQLEQGRVYDVKNLGELVPGLTVAGTGQRGYPVIRGITTRTPDAGADTAVGQYIDQIYQPRVANSLTGLLDLDRIEVLKGPQGTLFGRNTIAGAINYVTKRPGDTLDVHGMAGTGNRGLFETRDSISGPINSTVSVGLAGMYRNDQGNIDVVNAQGKKIGDDGVNDYGGRLSVLWKPTAKLEIYGTAMYLRLRSATLNQADGNPSGVLAPNFARAGFYTPSSFVADYRQYQAGLTDPGYLRRNLAEYSLRADWSLSDYLTFTSLTGYQRFKLSSKQDLDNEVQEIATFYDNQKSDTVSQEFRLAGHSNVLKWNVGGNYFYDNLTVNEDTDISHIVPVPLLSSSAVKTTSWAVFGQGYLTPVDNLTITAGLRYSHDHRDYRETQQFFPIGQNYDSALVPSWNTTPSWSNVSYTVGVDYHLRKGLMVYVSHSRGYRSGGIQQRAQTVAEASQNYGPEVARQYEIGLKSEFLDRKLIFNVAAYRIDYSDIQINQVSFNGAFAASVIQNAAKARMEGVEVDGKAYLSRAISVDFGYSYNNSRFLDYRSSTNIPQSIASLGYCPALPTAYGCSANDYIYDGVPFEFAPRNSFNVATNFDHEFGNGSTLNLRMEYSWKGSHLLIPTPQSVYDLSSNILDSHFIRQSAYGLLNGRVTFGLPGQKLSVSLWGKNLTGQRYAVLGTTDPSVVRTPGLGDNLTLGDRRTYGASLTFHY